MKQAQIDLISRALEEAYRALTLNDKDIAMNCIVYVQSIINPTEESHHPDCPAIDGFGCQCEQLAALSCPYAERGLESRTTKTKHTQHIEGWTDAQIANYFESL